MSATMTACPFEPDYTHGMWDDLPAGDDLAIPPSESLRRAASRTNGWFYKRDMNPGRTKGRKARSTK